MLIKVAARDSPLSRAQVREVLSEIKAYVREIEFDVHYLKTSGDLDLLTPLESLGRTDFFTKEIDEMVFKGEISLGIHSAKDLPFPLREGLKVIAITEGIDASDTLVFKEGFTLHSLPFQSKVGVSSTRRAAFIRQLREDLIPVSIRGNIQQRLLLLETKEIDALVLAEAALIRLGLTNLPRMKLEVETLFFQGKLAVISRDGDPLEKIFKSIDRYSQVFYEPPYENSYS